MADCVELRTDGELLVEPTTLLLGMHLRGDDEEKDDDDEDLDTGMPDEGVSRNASARLTSG